MEVVLGTILPVAAVVAIGAWIAGRPGFSVATVSELALWVTSPALLFSVLGGTPLDPGRWLALGGGTLAIVAGTAGLATLAMRRSGLGRGLLLPSVFFNGGNMGLACARLAFGEPGLQAGAVAFVTIALTTSFLGIWIAKGEDGLREALRMPLLWGSAGGIAVSAAGVSPPRVVMEPIEMLGAMAIPLMLVNLGAQLRSLRIGDARHALLAVAIRMGGGFACALAFATALSIGGVERQVLLLMSVMPSAVINAVIAERYGTDPQLVASAIVLSTLASLVSIPAVLLFVGA